MGKPIKVDWKQLEEIVEKYRNESWSLIPLLQEIQEAFSYIPPESIEPISEALRLFPSEVQGVITFYSGFSLKPKGKYVLKICRGTACHVKGGNSVIKILKQDLELDEGETSSDYQFTLETTACLGACALAPTMMVNKTYFGKLTPRKLTNILTEYGKDTKTK